jgi:sugar phosphate isomerase/epimerase
MKLSVAVAPDNAPDKAFVVFRGIESSIAKAAKLGYEGIELAVSCASDVQGTKLSRWLAQYNMEVSAVSTGLVYAEKGISLLETPDTAVPAFIELIDIAADFGKQVNIGRSRGFKKNLSLLEAADALKKILAPVADHAVRKGVKLLLEPINRYETDWIHSVDEGAAVLDRINEDYLSLMPDVFHMNIEDRSFVDSFVTHKKYIHYIHLADSNRRAPGWGHLNFNDLFSILRDIEYTGWVSVEILPFPSPDEAAKQAADYLLPFLAKTR